MDQDHDGSRRLETNGHGEAASALRLLQAASGRRLLAMHALIVVVLLATAQNYDGSIHPISHWIVLVAYALCSLGLGLAERWDRNGKERTGSGFASRRAEGLAWASTALNAGVAIYVEIEHLLVGAAAGFDDAAGAVSKLPAFLLLLQTGLTMRVSHTVAFAAAVTLAWSGTILLAIRQEALLGPHVSLSDEAPALLTFIAASFVVVDGVRRLRGAVTMALRLEHERTMLARFVPGSVAVELAREGGLGTVRERHACLFALDIRGFSALTREQPRQQVVQALLDIRALAHASVTQHDGIVDKYIGDGVLAHFLVGSPERQARAALDAALTIRVRLDALNQKRRMGNLPPLAITIALHAGHVLAGVFDDGLRAEFTVLGPAMNMLARLEAQAKSEDLALAASDDVVKLLAGRLPPGLRTIRAAANDAVTESAPSLYAITHEVPVPA
ncbi:adenylate/guanylate cyclase domain-containing protein [Methylobacterium haplocladii]|uniref:Adenylate cyclase n=1 Tax=Methylobacterium haplocladii TaxID=1176176 RepID=A0A512ISS4_9HYPH|nr:adenylate/guanylate cyclase domain-containing protein [Methylobacterium haplocladii]GEP00755.1 adenylate cyclase [Methylobacterium haplocladii]GJD83089.1 Adenylate cyclase 1 [Methylobacterium haplocladii]GLS60686.1 adenylate cyclase [Methylobacterium haplocladii]